MRALGRLDNRYPWFSPYARFQRVFYEQAAQRHDERYFLVNVKWCARIRRREKHFDKKGSRIGGLSFGPNLPVNHNVRFIQDRQRGPA